MGLASFRTTKTWPRLNGREWMEPNLVSGFKKQNLFFLDVGGKFTHVNSSVMSYFWWECWRLILETITTGWIFCLILDILSGLRTHSPTQFIRIHKCDMPFPSFVNHLSNHALLGDCAWYWETSIKLQVRWYSPLLFSSVASRSLVFHRVGRSGDWIFRI